MDEALAWSPLLMPFVSAACSWSFAASSSATRVLSLHSSSCGRGPRHSCSFQCPAQAGTAAGAPAPPPPPVPPPACCALRLGLSKPRRSPAPHLLFRDEEGWTGSEELVGNAQGGPWVGQGLHQPCREAGHSVDGVSAWNAASMAQCKSHAGRGRRLAPPAGPPTSRASCRQAMPAEQRTRAPRQAAEGTPRVTKLSALPMPDLCLQPCRRCEWHARRQGSAARVGGGCRKEGCATKLWWWPPSAVGLLLPHATGVRAKDISSASTH